MRLGAFVMVLQLQGANDPMERHPTKFVARVPRTRIKHPQAVGVIIAEVAPSGWAMLKARLIKTTLLANYSTKKQPPAGPNLHRVTAARPSGCTCTPPLKRQASSPATVAGYGCVANAKLS